MKGTLRRRWSALDVGLRDAVLAGLLTVVVQIELLLGADDIEGPRVLQHVAFTVMTASLALRRRVPLAAPVLVSLGLIAQELIGSAPAASGFIALIIVVYSVATYAPTRKQAVLGLIAVLASLAIYPFTTDDEVKVGDEVVNALIPTMLWVLARVARERLDRAVTAERERLQQAREEERRRDEALAAERRRIARELHDTVAHGVTLMLLQTEVLRGDVADEATLDLVQDAGRVCLDDLRRLLVVLRDEHPDPGGVGTAQLPALIETARDSGTSVTYESPNEAPDLPASLDVVVFRVVQEALTNAVRYASGGEISVRWGLAAGQVEVLVEDDGARREVPAQGGSGHGLLGVRERVALHDGTLAAGPRADGRGWRVHAVLPLPIAVP